MKVLLRFKNKYFHYEFNSVNKVKLGWYYFPHYQSFVKIVEVNGERQSYKKVRNIKSFGRLLFIRKDK